VAAAAETLTRREKQQMLKTPSDRSRPLGWADRLARNLAAGLAQLMQPDI